MKILITLITFIVVTFIVLTSCTDYANEQVITATVTDKERINTGDYSYYLIFTDKGEYKITDQFFYFKFNSSELYGKLKINNKYKFKLHGYRNGFLSMYPNIHSYDLIE